MRVVCLAVLVGISSAGQVLSLLRPNGRARLVERGPLGADDVVEDFKLSLQRLRAAPNASQCLRTVLGYIERASSQPGSASRAICKWDPEFCNHVAPTPEALACLRAAGFDRETKDASGTPYLAQRRVPPRVLRALARELRAALDAEGGAAPPAPPPNASALVEASSAKRSAEKKARPTQAPGASQEHQLVEQIMGMISGIIKELERQAGRNPTQHLPGVSCCCCRRPPAHSRARARAGAGRRRT